MDYLVKDLLISILPPDDDALVDRLPWWIIGCSGGKTGYHITLCMWRWPWVCPGASVVGQAAAVSGGDPASMALLLTNLKKQLKIAIADLDRAESAVSSEFGPRAVEEVELLETQFKKTLEELEHEERTIGAQLQPQTVEQVEELEAKLEQAQTELRHLKSKLKKA